MSDHASSAAPTLPLIELRDLHFSYPYGPPVLKGLTLTVDRGEIFGLLGPNGAGKSTAFRILAGLDSATKGAALIGGQQIRFGDRNIYSTLGYMPDVGEVFDSATVEDLLRFFGRAQLLSEKTINARIEALLTRFRFSKLRSSELRKLSKGQKQQAHIMRCFIHKPSVVILDEPASHLDPVSRKLLLDILREERDQGCTIIISSHILPELSDLCTSLAILYDGRAVDQGRVAELIEKHQNYFVSYTLKLVDGIEQAFAVLQRVQLKALDRTSADTITFTLLNRGQVPGLLELLVRSRVRVLELARQKKDIEQIYMELVGSPQ